VSQGRKKTFYLKFIIRLLDGLKRATRRNFQTRPKILKKILEHQINQSERKPFQKKYIWYLKSQNFGWGIPDGIWPGKTIGLKVNSKNLNLKRKSVWAEKKKSYTD
jgi:hypothetical protein